MKKSLVFLALAAATALTGCVSQTQFLDSKQGMAIQTASDRARVSAEKQGTPAAGTAGMATATTGVVQGPAGARGAPGKAGAAHRGRYRLSMSLS